MRIRTLALNDVRGIGHLELTDLPPSGVIVIHGDNEAGKSTILDALDVVLNAKHTSKKSEVKALEPVGRDASPDITLSATVGPYDFTIRKRFGRARLSELHIVAPKNEQFTGREADDALARILDEHVDKELRSSLFVRQGMLDPAVSAAGIPSVTRALNGATETGSQEPEDTELLSRVHAEFERFFTNSGKKKASYAALETRVEGARTAAADARRRASELDAFVAEVGRCDNEIHAAEAELPGAEEDVAQREADAAVAREVGEKIEAARRERDRAGIDAQRAEDDFAARTAANERLAALRFEVLELEKEASGAQVRAVEEQDKLRALTESRDRARSAETEAREVAKRARQDVERARGARRKTELQHIVARADKATDELSAFLEQQPERRVTDADVRHAESAAAEEELQRRLRDASSARLDVSSDNDSEIAVDGEPRPLRGTTTVELHDGTSLQLGKFSVVYRAAPTGTDTEAPLREARMALNDSLEPFGCQNVDELRALRDAHAELSALIEAARRRRDEIADGHDVEVLRAELARLTTELGECEQIDEAAAVKTADEAEAELERATAALHEAEAALRPFAAGERSTEYTIISARLEAKKSELQAAERELEASAARVSTMALAQAKAAAAKAFDAAAARVAELEAELAQSNPDTAERLLEGARNRAQSLRERRSAAHLRSVELKGRIEAAIGAAETADRADAAVEAAEAELVRANRRAEAVKLLWDTLVSHRDASRRRYAEPFAQALNRYAAVVFGPGVEFTLGEDLTIAARTLGGVTIPLDQLSGGAKEQIGLLARFAIADLAGQGNGGAAPVPVVVDDVLGASDGDRLELMNALFDQVGKSAQVIVLTCYPQRFDRVAVARRVSVHELKS
ncbi:Chromosome partition protein Smc [Corynebacterium capitovis DSM 44611]|uniref:AAA family ATPase n=1 Tax=Corynebacterium capitovis TaxID=131081 RepID=UPI00035D7A5D|nr:ATP-binding protein [Corynebacterium capitovis]WKD57855.1 Chromosome partition protein Smc [Corynebacterium capitovis DSM 44611]